jgi:hypothetical protein
VGTEAVRDDVPVCKRLSASSRRAATGRLTYADAEAQAFELCVTEAANNELAVAITGTRPETRNLKP